MAEDEEIVYDFVTELFKHQSVSDYTYNRALAKFGEAGIVETAHIAGLSTMMSMMMNAVRVSARIPGEANHRSCVSAHVAGADDRTAVTVGRTLSGPTIGPDVRQ
jgi:hypothetical protein